MYHTMAQINEEHPHHIRHSCQEDHPWNNGGTDPGACPRCTALLLRRLEQLEQLDTQRTMALQHIFEATEPQKAPWPAFLDGLRAKLHGAATDGLQPLPEEEPDDHC
mgnify:CR=1 FL=1